jgi:GntR family transcriptional regulator
MSFQAARSRLSIENRRVEGKPSPEEIAVHGRPLRRAGLPLYKQVLAILRESITRASAIAGTPLPREADVARAFGVSLITVRHALRELEAEGLIRKRAAKPAIVADPDARLKPSFDFRTFAEIAAFTRNARLEVSTYRKGRAEIASRFFGLTPQQRVYVLSGILLAEGRPEAQITTYFPPSIGSRLARTAFDDPLIFRSVEKHLGMRMAAAQVTVRAEIADPRFARDLICEEGTPVLAMEMRYRTADGEPAELTIARHRADLFSLSYDIPNEALRNA